MEFKFKNSASKKFESLFEEYGSFQETKIVLEENLEITVKKCQQVENEFNQTFKVEWNSKGWEFEVILIFLFFQWVLCRLLKKLNL